MNQHSSENSFGFVFLFEFIMIDFPTQKRNGRPTSDIRLVNTKYSIIWNRLRNRFR